jgi:IS30 family transposase
VEQIARRIRLDFPDDESMRISHEAIYQALYIQGRGALRRELVACLRRGAGRFDIRSGLEDRLQLPVIYNNDGQAQPPTQFANRLLANLPISGL